MPVTQASAAIQRILALVYVLVWSWYEHVANSELIQRKPQRRLVLLIDEVEAHLHARWQRSIIPALMVAVRQLSSAVSLQIHLATHSPLVMASAETVFGDDDALHNLKLTDDVVELEVIPFIKRGTANAWLMNEAFGLKYPRPLDAAVTIDEAKQVQFAESADSATVREINDRLVELLPDDDEFWPRWRYFALKHGVPK